MPEFDIITYTIKYTWIFCGIACALGIILPLITLICNMLMPDPRELRSPKKKRKRRK